MANGPSVVEYLQAGLRAASARQSAIANNLANLNTPGYRRTTVEFEKLLQEALDSGRPVDLARLEPQIVHPADTAVDADGNDVDLDVEVGELVKNSVAQKTYLRLLGKVYRQMDLAMRAE